MAPAFSAIPLASCTIIEMYSNNARMWLYLDGCRRLAGSMQWQCNYTTDISHSTRTRLLRDERESLVFRKTYKKNICLINTIASTLSSNSWNENSLLELTPIGVWVPKCISNITGRKRRYAVLSQVLCESNYCRLSAVFSLRSIAYAAKPTSPTSKLLLAITE